MSSELKEAPYLHLLALLVQRQLNRRSQQSVLRRGAAFISLYLGREDASGAEVGFGWLTAAFWWFVIMTCFISLVPSLQKLVIIIVIVVVLLGLLALIIDFPLG